MRLIHPWAFALALVVPWLWWSATRRRSRIPAGRTAWRTATVLLLVLAAGGVSVATGPAALTVMVVLDRSASLSSADQRRALDRVNALATTMRTGDQLGIVGFGRDATMARRPDAVVSPLTSAQLVVDRTGTNVGAGLRLARAALPTGTARRLLLASDGRETTGDATREALFAADAGVPIDILAPGSPTAVAMRVTRVVAPDEVRIDEPFVVSAEVAGESGARGLLAIYRDDQRVDRRIVLIGADGTGTAAIVERHSQQGMPVYRAAIESENGLGDGSPKGAVVVVTGRPRVLYVTSTQPTLGPALAAAGVEVTAVGPASFPDNPQALFAFDGIVLDDVPSDQLSSGAFDALTNHVESAGGGLLMLGSSRSLQLAGYPTTTIERILPLDLRPRSGARAPSLELVLVFDKSGSMADTAEGTPKIEAAREAVMGALTVLSPTDSVGVIAFAARPEVLAPLAPSPDAAALRTALQQVVPAGPTSIAPAVETALRWLRAPGRPLAARRQVLLISDGRTTDMDADRLRQLARAGDAEISVVAIGTGANRPLLEELASTSGGRAYFPDRLQDLPRDVAREAARSSGGGVVREFFVPRALSHPSLVGITGGAMPPLSGYVVSALKPTASPVLASHLDDPILAAWQVGLGRVAVFTADLNSPWSTQLRSWPESSRMWTQVVRWLSRRSSDPSMRLSLRETDGGPRLTAEATDLDGELLGLVEVTAVVRSAAEKVQQVSLEAVAPGRFEALLPITEEGPYVVAVTGRERNSGAEHRLVRGLFWSADREGEARGDDPALLSRLASLTGGRLVGAAESPFEAPRPSGYRDVSMWAAGAALVMFVLDIAGSRFGGKRRREKVRDVRSSRQKPVAA